MNDKSQLEQYYETYLKEIRNLKDSSVRHYFDAINWISRRLREQEIIKESLFNIQDTETLREIESALENDQEYKSIDKRGHQMYSSAFHNYLRFAHGEEFSGIGSEIIRLDIPIERSGDQEVTTIRRQRSGIIKHQALELAGFNCELNNSHKTFIAKVNSRQYMEGHHAIPLRNQDRFKNSLDVYANIVCLCPICHRFIHYGIDDERKEAVRKIYRVRGPRLSNSGISLSEDEFLELTVK